MDFQFLKGGERVVLIVEFFIQNVVIVVKIINIYRKDKRKKEVGN